VIEDNPESHSGSMSSMKNLEDTDNFGDQFLYDKPTEDDQEKSKVVNESDFTILDPSHQTVTTTLPEITTFIALQLRVAKLEKDMSEVKKTDHSAAVSASIKSQVPAVKYSVLPGPESIKNQESEKSPKEIIRIKKEQCEKKQESTYTIRSTDKVALEEFDLKNSLFKHMHKNRTANRNPANFHLYHALMEALIADEDAMDKEVKDREKTTRERHDNLRTPITPHSQGVRPLLGFKPIPKQRPDYTLNPEWTIPPNDFPELENNWANTYATTRTGKKKLCKADLEGPAFNLVKAFHKNNVFLQYQMDECHKLLTNKVDLSNPEGHQILRNIYEPLPLGGPPGQVTIQPQFFFNKDLDYLLTGDKERRIALSISKLKAARYLDFGLEELVPSLWVESERDYDISAAYGITHWWFRRKEFYINKHSEPSDREAVRSQMRILSVISVKVFEKYGYNYLREIILRRADYQEYKISEKDFKNLHPNDFEDLFLLNIQEKLNHLPKTDKTSLHTAVNMWIRNLVIRNRVGDLQLGIESYQTKINLERPNWDAADYYFKEDYTIVPKPRAVVYRDRNDQRKLMRLNELHKFSDGTLTRVMEKLDHMVKDFHLFEYNKGMETRKWSEDDKRRSKDFITAIEKRL
ncbi:hypothetical protein Tco_1022969, partial [Tanacetum coccineum]